MKNVTEVDREEDAGESCNLCGPLSNAAWFVKFCANEGRLERMRVYSAEV
jgi:hypothetical protein